MKSATRKRLLRIEDGFGGLVNELMIAVNKHVDCEWDLHVSNDGVEVRLWTELGNEICCTSYMFTILSWQYSRFIRVHHVHHRVIEMTQSHNKKIQQYRGDNERRRSL